MEPMGDEIQVSASDGAKEPKSKKKGAIIAIVALALVIGVAVFAYSALPGLRASTPYKIISADEVDPFFSSNLMACEIESVDGKTVKLADLSSSTGKPIVINLWATWCPHCIEEMDAYQKLYDEYADQVEFVILNVADSKAESEKAHGYAQENGYTFPVYIDTNASVREALSATGIPMTAVVSADGNVVVLRSGTITYDAMKSTLGDKTICPS